MSLTREQRRMAAMATLEAARTGGQLPTEIWASAQRKDDELIELATAYRDSRKQEVLENIVLTLAALESLARPYTVVYQPPTGGTPVPAPAAPTTPTSPSSGTRKWAPSQATPPVSPTPAPSPAPASDDSKVPTWLGPFVASRIVPIEDEVNSLGKRTTALEADMKELKASKAHTKAPLKKVWASIGLGLLVGLLIGFGLFSVIGVVVAIVLGFASFLLVTGAMIGIFNHNRNAAPAQ